MPKYLIINADDYGMSQSANEAVEALFEEGCITSTTLMTPCPWAEDAVARALANPKMRVGLHTTLNAEWGGYRWGPVARGAVPSLLDAAGYFPYDVPELLAKCTDADVETELNAQLDFLLARGLTPTYIDNHMGSVYGIDGRTLMPIVLRLCARGAYPFRLPRSTAYFGEVPPEAAAALASVVAACDALGVGTLDHLCTRHGELSERDGYDALKRAYLDLVAGLPEGVTEMYLHPAADSRELRAMTSCWFLRVWEYRFLRDPDFAAALEEHKVVRIGWEDVRR